MNNKNIIINHFLTSVNASNCYIVGCPQEKTAVIIDPAEFSREMVDFLEKNELSVEFVFLTHNHYDHNQGLSDVLDNFSAEVINGESNPVREGLTVHSGTPKWEVFPTPGHTDDSVSFLTGNMIFVGDLLFAGAVGGTSSYENHMREIDHIRHKVLTLPENTVIYPGHGSASTVRIERRYNPFVIDKF